MDEQLRKLAEAPLADPLKINLPLGRQPARREPREPYTPREGDLTSAQVRERRQKAISEKQETLLRYYAGTEVPAERVAEHVGLYRYEEYKPYGWKEGERLATRRVLDVERAKKTLAAMRKQ